MGSRRLRIYVFTRHRKFTDTNGRYLPSTPRGFTEPIGSIRIILTEEIVVEWIKAALEVESIETALEAQIQLQKEPVSASGIPWS